MLELLPVLGGWLLPVVSTVIVVLAAWGIKKLLDKIGVDRGTKIDNMIDRYVRIGVNAAEVWAKTKLDERKPSGEEKMGKAVDTVLRELDQSGIKKVGTDLIVDRIESYLYETKKLESLMKKEDG